jgi:DNA (cytosine-5)-methyltransferase 1
VKHIELFAGAGGLALGCAQAGFDPFIYVENDKYCARTLRTNNMMSRGAMALIEDRDVREVSFKDLQTDIALLSGGIPCQPWSRGGLAKGIEDERNLWPEFVRVLGEVMPQAFIIENVQGILRPQFRQYFGYLMNALKSPTVRRWGDEPWESHANSVRYAGGKASLHYDITLVGVDAVNYGVPQHRKRLFVIGVRKDLGLPEFKFHYQYHFGPFNHLWTLRDAIGHLPEPYHCANCAIAGHYPDHIAWPGARIYRGHTPNELDEPAKTVKAGVHGMPGGEGIVRLDDGSIRYLTVRELARIQTFPDDYRFAGSRTQQVKQIGNAVPVKLAAYVAKSVYEYLKG